MNIAHAIHGLGLGGAQKVIASIVRGRQSDDFHYFVYSSSDGVHRKEIEEAGARVRILRRTIPKLDPIWIRRLAIAMREDEIDLVHAHLFGDSLHSYVAAHLVGNLPVMMTVHIGPEGWSALQRSTYPWLLSKCDAAAACSASVRRSIQDQYPGATRVMAAVPNGIEDLPLNEISAKHRMSLRENLGVAADSIVVASVGRLSEQKGSRFLIAGFAELLSRTSSQNLELVLFGDGELRQELEKQVCTEKLEDHVHFAGFRDNIIENLYAVDVVVFSSLFEGLPIALLEAMAAGRCLVCTDIPGHLDVVRDGREGLIVPTANASGLAEALVRVAENKELRKRLGVGARKRFRDEFTAHSMVSRYEDLYRRVASVESRDPCG